MKQDPLPLVYGGKRTAGEPVDSTKKRTRAHATVGGSVLGRLTYLTEARCTAREFWLESFSYLLTFGGGDDPHRGTKSDRHTEPNCRRKATVPTPGLRFPGVSRNALMLHAI